MADQPHSQSAKRTHTTASAFLHEFIVWTHTVLHSTLLSCDRMVMKTFAYPDVTNGTGTV